MTKTPREHDEATAALYFELAKAQQEIRYAQDRIMSYLGFKRHYFGRTASSQAWAEEQSDGHWHRVSFADAVSRLSTVEKSDTLYERYGQATVNAQSIKSEIDTMDEQYTGWSRFFLVTSSAGHIHSSMHCSTCFPTTTYGWLPELSGKTEAEAIAQCGPTLCSICFPSAPVESQTLKVSVQDAQEWAWSPDRAEKVAAKQADIERKAAAKAKKAANKLKLDERLAHKVNELVEKFGTVGINRDRYLAADNFSLNNQGYDTAFNVWADMVERVA